MMKLTPLEQQVTQMLLDGDDETLSVLRQQAERADVSSREMTGVGFYTKFLVPSSSARPAGQPSFKLGDVNGSAANLKHGCGFLLYVDDGTLTMLEGYTYDEPWPDEIQELKLEYSSGPDRDMEQVRKEIQK